ncbi:restriction endonuclease [Candidatus Poribacteria bacterium]|nr:restriction endonuclease [Candidatus Poribacteria bacterium]
MIFHHRAYRLLDRAANWASRRPLWVSGAVPLTATVIGLTLVGLSRTPAAIVIAICWVISFVGLCVSIGGEVLKSDRVMHLPRASTLEEIRGIRWHDFERFVGSLFELDGYDVEWVGQSGADGGVDLILRRDKQTTLVQCKQHRDEPVGVKPARELYGVMCRRQAESAILVTSGVFSEAVQDEFRKDQRLQLLNGDDLMALISRLKEAHPEGSAQRDGVVPGWVRDLLRQSASVSGSIRVPSCPNCGTRMVLRQNREGKDRFWGCPNYGAKQCRGMRRLTPEEKDVLAP